jgi:hypothetical protein
MRRVKDEAKALRWNKIIAEHEESFMGKQDKWVNRWVVRSASDPTETYIVGQDANGNYGCSCKGWIFHHSKPGFVNDEHKHIAWVIAAGGTHAYGVMTMTEAVVERLVGGL